jgi:hypothetical protein
VWWPSTAKGGGRALRESVDLEEDAVEAEDRPRVVAGG